MLDWFLASTHFMPTSFSGGAFFGFAMEFSRLGYGIGIHWDSKHGILDGDLHFTLVHNTIAARLDRTFFRVFKGGNALEGRRMRRLHCIGAGRDYWDERGLRWDENIKGLVPA